MVSDFVKEHYGFLRVSQETFLRLSLQLKAKIVSASASFLGIGLVDHLQTGLAHPM